MSLNRLDGIARIAAIGLGRAALMAAGQIGADEADAVAAEAIRRFDLRQS